jgi:two-component system, chemotaxis family, chemotaxis protein CheY
MPIIAHNNQPMTGDPRDCVQRVLIVDDQLVVRGAVRSALEKMDRAFLVIEADSGEEALKIMCNAHVDIIFCDIQLPGMTGPEALVQAFGDKANRPFMVLMSTRQSEGVREIGRKVGVYEFMPKPFASQDVINAIAAFDRLSQITRVMLVDDSSTARKLMTRILGRSQFHIDLTEADSGNAAIEVAMFRPFDVIFCDFNMPGLDGVETAGKLLQMNPRAQIVLISTEQQAGMVRSAQGVGAFAFLKKPFTPNDVDAVLHDAFAIKRPSISLPTHAIFSNEEALRSPEAGVA